MRNLAWPAAVLILATTAACGSDDGGTSATGGASGAGGTGGAGGSTGGTGGASDLNLEPGAVVELVVKAGKASVHLPTPGGAEEYVLIVASAELDSSTPEHAYSVTAAPSTDASPTQADTATLVTGCSIDAGAFKGQPLPTETPPTGSGPKVGDKKQISIGTKSGSETFDAEVVAVGQTAVVWADVSTAHPAVLDSALVQEFLNDFEKTILPRERTIFGVESDEDKNGHIQLVFTPLTYDTAVAFFTSCDLAPSAFCPPGNSGEYLYLTPPNAIDPPYNTPSAIKEILAHELSHMLHYGHKVLKNGLSGWVESAYMAEGIGGFAQDVSGYQAGNFYVAKAGLDEIDAFSLADTLADNVEYDFARDGALRGGSYWFVRYVYDRGGGDLAKPDGSIESRGGPVLLRALIEPPESISAVLPGLAKTTPADIAADFWTTLAMSNRDAVGGVAPKNPCFAFLPTAEDPITKRQRGGSVYASFHGQSMTGPKVQELSAVDGSLRAGGGELVRIVADSGAAALDLNVEVDAAAPVRIRLGRVK
ncbi:MAG: hypothetical protein U0263_10800 [Polyangiaceae bacterium]